MMARCLDARLALAKLPVAASMSSGSVVLLLTDKMLERNNHLLQLRTSPGKLEAVSTLEQEEVTMDMGTFYPAFTSVRSALRSCGKQGASNAAMCGSCSCSMSSFLNAAPIITNIFKAYAGCRMFRQPVFSTEKPMPYLA